MNYQKILPKPELNRYVECFFEWSGLADKEIDIQSSPSSFCGLVINCADKMSGYQNSEHKYELPSAYLCGIFTSNYHLLVKGHITIVGIVLKSCAIHDFFGIRMSTLVNSRLDLLHLSNFNHSIISSVRAVDSIEMKVRLLQEMLIEKLIVAQAKANIINEVALEIDRLNGQVTVEALAEKFYISKRYLEKQFLEKVGVSPKMYARIKRFVVVANQVAHNKEIDWQKLIVEGGLHDQSHLIKEFREFNKTNPTKYHQNHTELTRYIKDVPVNGLNDEK